jgi:hypothetical protein
LKNSSMKGRMNSLAGYAGNLIGRNSVNHEAMPAISLNFL